MMWMLVIPSALAISLAVWLKRRKKPLRKVTHEGYTIEFIQFYWNQGVVVYREGVNHLSWYGEWGADGSYLFWVPREVSFLLRPSEKETREMLERDLTLLKLPQTILGPQNLSEPQILQIKKRVSDGLDEMEIKHSFAREGWTSYGDANEITDSC